MRKALILFITFLAIAHAHAQDGAQYHRVELYFGRADNGRTISERKWRRFVSEHITPFFPQGLTVTDAAGQWRGKDNKIIREKSKVVILICKKDDTTTGHITQIKNAYMQLYHQESVMEVDIRTESVTF